MSWDAFIIPLVGIGIQVLKLTTKIKSTWLPHLSLLLGGVLGLIYALYYGDDILVKVVLGVIYGGTASGFYDTAASTTWHFNQVKNE